MQRHAMSLEGGCTCGAVRYRINRSPLLVHCCHCSWCQRETGTAFALNALVETGAIALLGAAPEVVLTPSLSGKGQKIMRCTTCRVAVWSHYASLDTKLAFVRVGTLDQPALCPPGVHIFTASKQPWVTLSADTSRYEAFYTPDDWAHLYGADSMARLSTLRGMIIHEGRE